MHQRRQLLGIRPNTIVSFFVPYFEQQLQEGQILFFIFKAGTADYVFRP